MRIFRTTAIVAASAIALALIAVAPARAAHPVGTWLTGDKKGKVKIVNCGGAICGTLTWLAEPPDPCSLVTVKDAATVLGATPPHGRAQRNGATRSCNAVHW